MKYREKYPKAKKLKEIEEHLCRLPKYGLCDRKNCKVQTDWFDDLLGLHCCSEEHRRDLWKQFCRAIESDKFFDFVIAKLNLEPLAVKK